MPNQDADPGEATEPLTSRRAASAGRRRSRLWTGSRLPRFNGMQKSPRKTRSRRKTSRSGALRPGGTLPMCVTRPGAVVVWPDHPEMAEMAPAHAEHRESICLAKLPEPCL